MTRVTRALLLLGLAASSAQAQDARYQVRHALDFDLWCTEEQRLPYQRCEKRLPEDLQRFEAYRAVIERYEIPYLKDRDKTLRLDEDLLGSDPADQHTSPNDGK
jgi:hypothetical protein